MLILSETAVEVNFIKPKYFSSVFIKDSRWNHPPHIRMMFRNMPTLLFLLVWLVPFITQAASASAHKHSHGKERLEDGGFNPRDHDHFDGEGLSSLIYYINLCFKIIIFMF